MQAEHPETSKLAVNFGEKHGASTPLNLELTLDIFSQEQEHIKKQLAAQYGIEIPQTCIAFEIVVTSGSAQEKAESLAKIKESLSILEQVPNSFTTKHSGNKVLALFQAPEFADLISSYQTHFSDLKVEAKNEAHLIMMKIFSNNDLAKIGKKMEKDGKYAWINSLHYELEFVKNQFMTKIILIFCEKILENDQFSPMIRSFKKFNLELNFASSRYLRIFPKVRMGEKPSLPRTDLSLFLEEAGVERGKLLVFNPTLFVKGDFQATGLSTLLKTVLE